MTGFTGVVWDARTSERLATDLLTPAPMTDAPPGGLTEAGFAWSSIAAELGSAGAQYSAILARLGMHWQSGSSTQAIERLTALSAWFGDAARQAAEAAVMVQAQAAAQTVARLAMPNPEEIELVDTLAQIATTAATLVPIAVGAAAHAERAAHQQRMRAAQVMHAYEAAAEPVARPWRSAHPAPTLVSDGPLRDQHSRAEAARATDPPGATSAPASSAVPLALGVSPVAREQTRYAPTILTSASASSLAPVGLHEPATPTPSSTSVPPPISPGHLAGDRVATRISSQHTPDVDAVAPAGMVTAAEMPTTWADLATSDVAVVQVEVDRDLDPRYVTQMLTLDPPADTR